MSRRMLLEDNHSENGLMPVTDGLICWLDAMDLKDTNDGTIWKDRSGDGNHATLKRKDLNSIPIIENGYYRTYDSGYVILPSLNFNSTDGITIFLDFKLHKPSNYQYARLFTIGYGDYTQAQFGLDDGRDEFGAIRCFNISTSSNYGFYYLKSGIYNKQINMSISYNGSYILGNNYTDNIKKSFVFSTRFDYLFNYNYLNGSSPTFINPIDTSYGLILIYNRALTEEEMEQNYLYEQSIERGNNYVRKIRK